MKLQITNSKSQINSNDQISNVRNRFGHWKIGIWILFVIWCLGFGIFSYSCFAADEQVIFPFTGKAKVDNVNLRAGADKNFEVLSILNSDDTLMVLGRSYDWYKVELPQSAHCYVAKEYIEKRDTGEYASKADSLNVRSRPGVDSSILGQINRGDVVSVVGEDRDGWYEILPVKNTYGWVYFGLINKVTMQPAAEELPQPKPAKPQKKRGFLWW